MENEQTSTSINWQEVWNSIVNWCTDKGLKLIIVIVVGFILFKLIDLIARKIQKAILQPKVVKSNLKFAKLPPDKTLVKTVIYTAKIVIKVLLVAAAVSFLGIDTSAFASIIASIGVCIGLAVNGALSNLAGGIMLLITRPFSEDDYIESGDYAGTVEDIKIVYTVIRTPDNKVIHIPNGTLSTSTIINYSKKETRRMDLIFTISYSESFEKAQKVIYNVLENNEMVLNDPKPMVRINEQADSSINILARVWVKNSNYWDLYFDLQESIYKELKDNNIDIPFNQLDVHIKND